MSEEKIKDTADAVRGLVEAVPVYQDVVQPAAREVGVALQTTAKLLHVALLPITAVVWGSEQIWGYLKDTLAEKLKDVPEERIETPPVAVAGPAFEALRFAGEDHHLRELYANLLARAIDRKTVRQAHPAFVEIIKQMVPDEARILRLFPSMGYRCAVVNLSLRDPHTGSNKVMQNCTILPYLANCDHPNFGRAYVDNLCRLGLFSLAATSPFSAHTEILLHPRIQEAVQVMKMDIGTDEMPRIAHKGMMATNFGIQFIDACVVPPDAPPSATARGRPSLG